MLESHVQTPRFSIALISASALGYEILLMRLFSIIQWHHFGYMIISLALLGYGMSGSFLALARERLLAHFPGVYVAQLVLFGLTAPACFLLAQQVAFNPEELLWDWRQPLRLLLLYVLLTLPFFFAANAVGLALSRFQDAAPRLYAADLLGAGLGSVAIVALLFVFMPGAVLVALGGLGFAAAALAGWEMRLRRWTLGWGLVALLPLVLPASWTAPAMSPYKELSQLLRIEGTRVVGEYSSPLGLLSVVESPRLPLRHAPGLSLLATTEPPEQVGVFTDGDAMTVLTRDEGGRERFAYLDFVTSALPYHVGAPRRVLVLGAGGGSEVLQARYHGAERIDAVELNAQLVELVRGPYREFTGGLYDRPEVRVHVAEARGFVAASAERYDLIQLALVDAFGASAAGLHALNESYLYTREALAEYLAHLAPGGYLAISRWVQLPPRDAPRLFATALAALGDLGVAEPGRRLALIRGWQTSTLLIKNGDFSEPELESLRRFCAERAFDPAYYPGMRAEEANRVNRLRAPYFYDAAQALLGDRAEDFQARYKFNIEPATDDRPYFFHFFKWSALPELLALGGQGGFPLLEWGYLILVATLIQAVLVSLALILLPLAGRRRAAAAVPVGRAWVLVYFGAIGLAFLSLEIAFIQKFILFLHHPLYAVAVVLSGFLVCAGLGSAWSARLARRVGERVVVGGAVAVIVSYGLLLLWLSRALFPYLAGLTDLGKIPLALLLIAPLAFCMGMPFPLALARLGRAAPRLIPWAWAVNGCASVLSAVLASLLAIHLGFNLVVLAALLLYAVAWWVFPRSPA